jgi:DNA-binding NtrC family response regulator
MSQPHTQLRVFVVDDEFVIASTLGLILRHKNFDAISFHAPLDALEAASSQAPDLLISDVVMPQISGIELAIRLQEQCPNCKVLLFSGQAATAGLLETARAKGHNFEILSKPVHPTDLLRKIAESTGNAQLRPSASDETPGELALNPSLGAGSE